MRPIYSALISAVLLPGCIEVAEPLGDIEKAEPDKRLVGKWGLRPAEGFADLPDLGTLVIDTPVVKGNPKGLMRAVVIATPDKELFKFWFYCTTIGKHSYATIYVKPRVDGDGFADFHEEGAFKLYVDRELERYYIIKYTLDGDKLYADGGDESKFSSLQRDENFTTLAKHLAKSGPDNIYRGKDMQECRRVKVR